MRLTKPVIESLLATALGRRDEAPNIELAERIVQSNEQRAVAALAAILETGGRAAQQDALKVLYEIGERQPPLILHQLPVLIGTLTSKNNRLVWGGLTALAKLSNLAPDKIFPHLDKVLNAADAGSVIAKDRAIDILVGLADTAAYCNEVMPIIVKRLKTSAVNQLPMYAEKVARLTLARPHTDTIIHTMESRLNEPMSPAKKKRIEKVINSLS